MYAIVKSGGKQYRVEPGQRLLVERLSADVGATVALEPLLYRSDDVAFDAESLARVTVSAKVLAHERGPKLRVFKFKPKRGYKRRTGHRQELTRIEVGEIKAASARSRSAATAKDERGTAEPAPARRAPARKPAAERAAAAKAPKAATRKTTSKESTGKESASKESGDGA
jgi:large subunit ribosomal protein L21